MENWFIYSILAMVLWGFWGFLPKLSLAHLNPQSTQIWQSLGGTIAAVIYLFFVSRSLQTAPIGIAAGIATGLFAFLGTLCFIFALSTGKSSVVVMMTALYPLITMLLSFVFLHETLTFTNMVGAVFAIIAIILFAH